MNEPCLAFFCLHFCRWMRKIVHSWSLRVFVFPFFFCWSWRYHWCDDPLVIIVMMIMQYMFCGMIKHGFLLPKICSMNRNRRRQLGFRRLMNSNIFPSLWNELKLSWHIMCVSVMLSLHVNMISRKCVRFTKHELV